MDLELDKHCDGLDIRAYIMVVLGTNQVHTDSSNHNDITNLKLVGVLLEGVHDNTSWYWL